jgi:hypothetical protein
MAGKIIADTLEHSTAGSVTTDYVVSAIPKVWFQIDGTGTVAIDGSFNASSLTDDFTGSYTITYTNSLSDSNYAVTQGAEYTYNGSMVIETYNEANKTSGKIKVLHNTATGANNTDVPEASGIVAGDLA